SIAVKTRLNLNRSESTGLPTPLCFQPNDSTPRWRRRSLHCGITIRPMTGWGVNHVGPTRPMSSWDVYFTSHRFRTLAAVEPPMFRPVVGLYQAQGGTPK